MRKKRFRIISYPKGDLYLYETKVKTWFGWASFTVFYKTDILHIFSDPSVQKALAYERIYQYCHIRGYKTKDIEVTEIDKSKNRQRLFIQRIFQLVG
jgi:hypothetical protein